jgi:nucleotide-binding universal stress UspA family protein
MFTRVLVAVDGRAGGRDAIALAQQLVTSTSRLVLANVYGTSAMRGAAGAGGEAEDAHHLLTRARQDHGLECRIVIRLDSSPGRGLHRLAQHERADLLVVGSSHRGGLGRVVIGDDTLAALNGAPCAVAIAPRGYVSARPDWTTIGVGDDGSPESTLALAAARDLAERHHAEVRVLSVVELEGVLPVSVEPTDWTSETIEAMRVKRSRLQEIPGADADVVFGDPAQELTRLAHAVDLLVVGSRAKGPLGRFVNGSVSRHLARHSACPLLVVPRTVSQTGPLVSDGPSRDLRVPVEPTS